MTTTNEQQRELLRSAYPESVRFKALRRLAQTAGIVRVLPRLYDLAREAESDWIALQANVMIADDRPTPRVSRRDKHQAPFPPPTLTTPPLNQLNIPGPD